MMKRLTLFFSLFAVICGFGAIGVGIGAEVSPPKHPDWIAGFLDTVLGEMDIGSGVWLWRRYDKYRKTEANYQHSEASGGPQIPHYPINSPQGAIGFTTTNSGSLVEHVTQSEPIRAWRGLSLMANDITVWMNAINVNFGDFGADETRALCNMGVNHQSPDLNCQCGFYSVKNKEDVQSDSVVAEADYYGRIIEHEKGYRAEYQRILSLRVKRSFCMGGFLCEKPVELISFPSPMLNAMFFGLQSVCKDHAEGVERVATLQQIAARLGVEVRWDD